MSIPRKQLKITKLLKKGATRVQSDNDELQEEVRLLEQQLREKQTELFQIQRNQNIWKASLPKKKEDSFLRPETIILNNSIETLKRKQDLIAMLTGMEVQSYKAGEHCCVLYHMQHESKHAVTHGLKIDLQPGNIKISSTSLPLGFNLTAVTDKYDCVSSPQCLSAVRRALVAYYDRLEQFDKLKALVTIEAELFKTLDGSHMEMMMHLKGDDEEDRPFPLTLVLDYRVDDIRPKSFTIKGDDEGMPEGATDIIREQCAVFKKKPLRKAFKQAFRSDLAQYKLVRQLGVQSPEQQRSKKRLRPNRNNFNDETFQPEDCSEDDDDDE